MRSNPSFSPREIVFDTRPLAIDRQQTDRPTYVVSVEDGKRLARSFSQGNPATTHENSRNHVLTVAAFGCPRGCVLLRRNNRNVSAVYC